MKITVFTPTYNRAYILGNLYRSLKKQSYKDFEWLIIDDGSTDNTRKLVEEFKKENNDFPIRYYKKDNGGKCSAINYALDFAEGLLFLTIDSDDILTSDALQRISDWENQIHSDSRFCGVAGNLGTSETETPNKIFEKGFKDASLLERYNDVTGERALAFYTDIHKRYRYPLYEGEKFMTEAVVWNRIASDGYIMRFFNDIVCVYEYRNDGLTKAGSDLFTSNPRGYGLWLKEKQLFTNPSVACKLKLYYSFTSELYKKYDTKKIAECIGSSPTVISLCKFAHKLKTKFRG